ncbi:hypothetical protein BDZ89DRAFT_1039356 [Hymenopellis radicata]|nr:hypothetical protein BDZ89DRAFT_1039356 [Hymenopellis radicata]
MRQQYNDNPAVGGSPDTGWESMPDVQDATAYRDWVVDATAGAVMPLYQTANQNNLAIKRAVIVLAGKGRDAWSYWNTLNNALYNAAYQDSSIVREEISLMAPCWWTEADLNAGAGEQGQLIWGKMTWVSGHYNVAPDSVSKFSSFQVLDALVAQYMDQSVYPNLNTVVIAGHSAGAQMAQRYAALRATTDNDDRLHYWIGNPGSLLWLTTDRPAPNSNCSDPGYATKDANSLGRDGIVERYRGRKVNYAWGTADNGPGDTRCQAVTQGSTHYERGQNYVAMLENMDGGMPSDQTVDWIEGVSHDNEAMMNSAAGLEKLFKYVA